MGKKTTEDINVEGFKSFKNAVVNAHSKGLSKIRNSWGVYSAYKHIRKNKWYDIGRPVTENEFYTIIRSVNKMLAEDIVNGKTVVFPHRMGCLELRRYQRGVSLIDGKLKVTYPVDWWGTLNLWYQDKEARDNKILLRNEDKYVYHVKYNKHNALYNNKMFYMFAVNRFIKRKLKENIKAGKIDALW